MHVFWTIRKANLRAALYMQTGQTVYHCLMMDEQYYFAICRLLYSLHVHQVTEGKRIRGSAFCFRLQDHHRWSLHRHALCSSAPALRHREFCDIRHILSLRVIFVAALAAPVFPPQ